ncbi:MAG: HAMP domain-containing protein, partial [Tatlockia sp.]|nr:HAMP domain-containing protein [Tatlockia sp.]
MLIMFALFYWAMLNVLHNADEQFISDEIIILSNILKQDNFDLKAIKQEVQDIPQSLENSFYHYYIRILDKDQNIVAITPNIESINFNFPNSNLNVWWDAPNGKQYLLRQAVTTVNNNIWKIQIALDISHQQLIIAQYRNIVLLVIFISLILCIFIGHVISRYGMKSLKDLTEKTKKITAHDIQQRIDSKLWPQELQELGDAFNNMLERIEDSFHRLNQLSNDLAHELRIPLTNLKGEAEIALSMNY